MNPLSDVPIEINIISKSYGLWGQSVVVSHLNDKTAVRNGIEIGPLSPFDSAILGVRLSAYTCVLHR